MGSKTLEKKNCPNCGKEMVPVYIRIDNFLGHHHIYPGPLRGYKCDNCGYEEKIYEEKIYKRKDKKTKKKKKK